MLKHEDIIGSTVKEIYETKPIITDGLFDSKALYFKIVIKLGDNRKILLGPHHVEIWKSNWWNFKNKLYKSGGTLWAKDHNLNYHDKKIAQVLTKDPQTNFDGSLMIVLENNVTLEHHCTNGDQLHIDNFEDIKDDWDAD